jgi:hypothetical protein
LERLSAMKFLAPPSRALAILALTFAVGCATMGVRSAVSMKVKRTDSAPKDALVYVDEEFIGTLAFVAERGVRVPEGEHRLSVEKNGYYPFDQIIVSDREPIFVEVTMLKLPE